MNNNGGSDAENVVIKTAIVKYIIVSLSIIVFILIVAGLIFREQFQSKQVSWGKADDFTLETIEGKEINLYTVLKTKPAVLVFWTTWCTFCRKEMPEIEEFHLRNQKKIKVIGINVEEDREKVERFINSIGISFPVVLDSDGKVKDLYGIKGIPVIFYIDEEKNILYYGHSLEEMQEEIKF